VRAVRVFVGGVGNPWLRDLDFGPQFVRRVEGHPWGDDVVVEDAAYSAHRVLHRLQELQPQRVVLLAGYPRGQPPGTIRRYLLDGPPPDPDEVTAVLGEAAGGVIDFQHTLMVLRYFDVLPADTVVVEVEALDTEFGTGFSEPVEESFDKVLEMVKQEVAR
jgi:hydrogenase maturation protease